MRYCLPICLLLFLFHASFGQNIRLHGNISDTAAKQSVPNVLLMAVRFSDSTLVSYSRSNKDGIIKPIIVPIDTYLVILSHPSFSDKTYFLVPSPTDTAFHFKNVIMPPKSVVLGEIEIIAHKEKSYYKGDTLIFTADSFKTRPNATVEDLLKKLPGFRVDAAGKISVQGKEVDQVLVDGDEFFGTDPTIATRNLNATAIANVQVFDKKNESTEDGAAETLKVVNLQMKDDAKKGYFGKVSGASDFQNFYEGELLMNKFKGNQKFSVFGLVANTPKQAFGHNDIWKYGLSGEQEWMYDQDNDSWSSNGNSRRTGIPQTIKGGFYFSDKYGKNTKLNADYTYGQNNLWQGSETNTQFFLTDTTYSNLKIKSSQSRSENHSLNLKVIQKIDSLTELTVLPKLRYNNGANSSVQTDDFISEENVRTRKTVLTNSNTTENSDANILFKVSRNFMKKDRNVSITYQPVLSRSSSSSLLNTDFTYFQSQLPDSHLVQQRKQENNKLEHNTGITYIEPFTKKFKTELSYNYSQNKNTSTRNTYDFAGSAYDIFNPQLSNNFENLRVINKAGAKLIYDVKKYRAVVGSFYRNIGQENLNVSTGKVLKLNVNNVLPFASFQYRISQGSNFSVNYNSNSQQPDLQQMQPVVDNSDPNRISIGNPNLRPTFSNNVSVNYYFYKGISDVNFWSGGNFSNTDDQFSFMTTFDSLGRAVTQPINVDGNYNGNVWFGGGFPVFKKFLKVYYNFNGNHSNNVSFVNGQRNDAQNTSLNPGINLAKNAEKYEIGIGANYSYNIPRSTISVLSVQPYYSYGIEGNISAKLPFKLFMSTDGAYTNNGNRTPGYNINYFIWNASFGKNFLKTENLAVSINAYDILNQNISNERMISSNQIMDTKTQIIRRYFLLKVLYKFNNQKTKVEDDDN